MSSINGIGGSDYSSLFSSLSTSGSSSALSNDAFTEYANIKNGSYGKTLKAYYAKKAAGESTSDTNTKSTGKDTATELTKVKTDADKLKASAESLLASGSKSLFNKKETTVKNADGTQTKTDYDMGAIYKGAKSFVDSYNAAIDSGADVNSPSILKQTLNLTKFTAANEDMLKKAGITIGEDNKLSIDEKKLKSADISDLKSLFSGNGSFAYNVSAKASSLSYNASNQAGKASSYNATGAYSNDFASGSIYNSTL